MTAPKGVPLAKDEVSLLIDLVESNKVVTNKATNASNNHLKEVAWNKIAEHFNASVSSCPRRTDQLKLKWENLKKAARKRSTKIRMNHLKTGGGKPEYIPPDDALERVASILGATCDGYSVQFGGDSMIIQDLDVDMVKGDLIVVSGDNSGGGDGSAGGGGDGSAGGDGGTGVCVRENAINTSEQNQLLPTTPKPKKFFFSTPSGSNVGKRKLVDEERKSRIMRNKAIAEYYILKKKRLELYIENVENKKN